MLYVLNMRVLIFFQNFIIIIIIFLFSCILLIFETRKNVKLYGMPIEIWKVDWNHNFLKWFFIDMFLCFIFFLETYNFNKTFLKGFLCNFGLISYLSLMKILTHFSIKITNAYITACCVIWVLCNKNAKRTTSFIK